MIYQTAKILKTVDCSMRESFSITRYMNANHLRMLKSGLWVVCLGSALLSCSTRGEESKEERASGVQSTAFISKKDSAEKANNKLFIEMTHSLGDLNKIRSMLDKGADINYRDENGFYLLYWAQYYEDHNNESNDRSSKLIAWGAIDFNAQVTDFFAYCEKGEFDSVRAWLSRGMDVNARRIWHDPMQEDESCDCYETALSVAAMSGNMELVKMLVDAGAEVNFSTSGRQPLQEAVVRRHYEMADFLLEHGARSQGAFALDLSLYSEAVSDRDTVLLDYLIRKEFPYSNYYYDSPLINAVKDKKMNVIRKLIPVSNAEDITDALCYSGSIPISELLLSHGADINGTHVYDGEGGCHAFRTPLIAAVNHAGSSGNLDLLRFLLDKHADVNNLDAEIAMEESCDEKSPLTHAVESGRLEVAALLLDNGANPNFYMKYRRDTVCFSPLIAAVANNQLQMVALLLAKGAKPVVGSMSIFQYIKPETSADIVALLKSKK